MTQGEEQRNLFERNRATTLFLVCCVLLGIPAFLTEGYLRVKKQYAQLASQPAFDTSHRFLRLRENKPSTSATARPDKKLLETSDGLEFRDYPFAIDAAGFVKPSGEYQNPDYSIVFVGGSTTECRFVGEQNRFPYLTGVLLSRKTGKKINTYNSGVSGNHSMHSICLLLGKILPMKPDAVVFMENMNDLHILMLAGSYWNDNPYRSLIVDGSPAPGLPSFPDYLAANYLQETFLPRNLLHRLLGFVSRPEASEPVDEWASVRGTHLELNGARISSEFDQSLRTFVAICRIRRITPVLMTQQNRLTPEPDGTISRTFEKLYRDYGIPYGEYQKLYSRLNDLIRDVGRREGLKVVDLDASIPHSSRYIYDSVHLNDEGSKMAAEIISSEILGLVSGESSAR